MRHKMSQYRESFQVTARKRLETATVSLAALLARMT